MEQKNVPYVGLHSDITDQKRSASAEVANCYRELVASVADVISLNIPRNQTRHISVTSFAVISVKFARSSGAFLNQLLILTYPSSMDSGVS